MKDEALNMSEEVNSAALRKKKTYGRTMLKLIIGVVLALCVALIIFQTYLSTKRTPQTNREYLADVIEHQIGRRTAEKLVTSTVPPVPAEIIKQVEDSLAACMTAAAKRYAESGDSYLSLPADTNTPTILTERLTSACGLKAQPPSSQK